jgi:hypothetical protein
MKHLFLLVAMLSTSLIIAQYDNEISDEYPFGKAHPDAPQQIKDFQPMIGECECNSVLRNQDQTWAEPETIIWKWKYIMNGKGVQDETLKPDGKHSGSIRQYIADSSRWYVHYYSSFLPSTTLPAWEGNKEDGKIILFKDQTAPNGMEGFYRITFYDMTETGYKWLGEWVDKEQKIVYPTWKIECTRKKD